MEKIASDPVVEKVPTFEEQLRASAKARRDEATAARTKRLAKDRAALGDPPYVGQKLDDVLDQIQEAMMSASSNGRLEVMSGYIHDQGEKTYAVAVRLVHWPDWEMRDNLRSVHSEARDEFVQACCLQILNGWKTRNPGISAALQPAGAMIVFEW